MSSNIMLIVPTIFIGKQKVEAITYKISGLMGHSAEHEGIRIEVNEAFGSHYKS